MIFSKNEIELCFPFFLATDLDGKVTYIGKSLSKIVGQKSIGIHLSSSFNFVLPVLMHQNNFDAYLNQTVLLVHNELNFKLIGQIIKDESNKLYIFAVSIQVHDIELFTKYGINFSSFAPQDQVFDFLMAFHSYKKSVIDATILNEELKKQKNIAIEALKMKSRFLANMSHELRTPLNGIIGMASVLQENLSESDSKEQIEIILASGEQLLSLINDILDLSKIEAGHIKIKPTKVNIRTFLLEFLETIEILAKKKSNILSLDIDENIPEYLFFDSVRLTQILTNLIGNAIKFTNNGKIETKVALVSNNNNKIELKFEVNDTGIGIPIEMLDKIFIPFVQVDQIEQKSSGTGLGLSICKNLINAMGGEIRVKSKINEGSRFNFNLVLGVN